MTITIDPTASIATSLAQATAAIQALGGRIPAPAATAGDTLTLMLAYASSLGTQGRPVPIQRIPEIKTVNTSSRPAYLPPSWFYKLAQQVIADPNEMPPFPMMTHMSVKSGNWTDPSVWDAGTVPTRDSVTMPIVMIGNGHHVVYDEVSSKPIYGVMGMPTSLFDIDVTKPTREIVYTNMWMGGYLSGKRGAPMSRQNPHETWYHGIPGTPGVTSNMGQMFMGTTSILGEAKASKLFTFTNIPAGTTSIPLAYLPTANWQDGDLVAIAGRRFSGFTSVDPTSTAPTICWYNSAAYAPSVFNGWVQLNQDVGFKQSEDEARYITISGGAIHFTDPLQFDHLIYTATLPSGDKVKVPNVIANFTRSIKRRTLGGVSGDLAIWSGADLTNMQKRATADMFMNGDWRHDERYVEFIEMGRTLDNVTLVATGQPRALCDASNGNDIANPLNVRGRYGGPHCHILGPFNARPQARVIGCSARGELFGVADTQAQRMARRPIPGKVFVHHMSNAAFEDNVTLNSRGPAWMSETGSEIGQHLGGVYMSVRGDGYSDGFGGRQENVNNHQGHEGNACESQSRQLLQQHNFVSGATKALNFLQQVTGEFYRVRDQFSLRYAHPLVGGKGVLASLYDATLADTYGVKQDMILAFDWNVAADCNKYMYRAQVEFIDRTDNTHFSSRGGVAINCYQMFDYTNYTQQYIAFDFYARGTRGVTGYASAIHLGNVEWGNSFNNGYIENFDQEFDNVAAGFNLNGRFIDISCDAGAVRGTDWTKTVDTTAHPLSTLPDRDLDGPWIDNHNGSITIKQFKVYSSATDMPVPYPGGHQTPPFGPGGVEPSPGTPKPYFVLDSASTLVFDPTTGSYPSVNGTITDGAGTYPWPYNFTSESYDPVTSNSSFVRNPTPYSGTASIMTLLKRNGVYKDGSGNVKCRMWFTVRDRLTKKEFVWYIDADVHNVSDADIAANGLLLASANDARPTTDLAAEDVTLTDFVFPPTAPTIAWFTTTSTTVKARQKLYLPLLMSLVKPTITVSGADASQVEVATIAGLSYLRWVGDGTKSQITPTDANGDSVYQLMLNVADQFGNAGPALAVAITVSAADETTGAFSNQSITFPNAVTPYEATAEWTILSAVPGTLFHQPSSDTANNNLLTMQGGLSDPLIYMARDTGSLHHSAETDTVYHSPVNDDTLGLCPAVSMSNVDNYIRLQSDYGYFSSQNSGNAQFFVYSVKNGVLTAYTLLGPVPGQYSDFRIEYDGTSHIATVKTRAQGGSTWTTIGSVTITDPPPATTRAGVWGGTQKDNYGPCYNFQSGPLS